MFQTTNQLVSKRGVPPTTGIHLGGIVSKDISTQLAFDRQASAMIVRIRFSNQLLLAICWQIPSVL